MLRSYSVGKLAATKSRRLKPPEIEDRAIPDHWKVDFIAGTASKNTISALAERSSGNVILLHQPDDHESGKAQGVIIKKMATLLKLMRNSLT